VSHPQARAKSCKKLRKPKGARSGSPISRSLERKTGARNPDRPKTRVRISPSRAKARKHRAKYYIFYLFTHRREGEGEGEGGVAEGRTMENGGSAPMTSAIEPFAFP